MSDTCKAQCKPPAPTRGLASTGPTGSPSQIWDQARTNWPQSDPETLGPTRPTESPSQQREQARKDLPWQLDPETLSPSLPTESPLYSDQPITEYLDAEGKDALKEFAASNYAVGAEFNAWQRDHEPPCLQGTRVALLEQIMHWSDNPSGPCMFWLNGRAGTGKSTIARTAARKWGRRVGASFFFSKGGGDLAHASKFVTTLAYQLAVTQPDLAGGIRTAIDQHPDIHLRGLHEQWKYLIAEPLSSWNGEALIMVIDALDECDNEGDTGLILRLLSRVVSTGRPPPLKIFISSTPETPMRYRFKDLSDTADRNTTLLEISKPTTSADVSIYLRDRFGSIRKHHGLCENWPDQGCLDRLVQKADGMFIYAATVCQFVGNARTDPKERLALVLEGSNDSAEEPPTGKLDKLYTTVLQRLVIAEPVSGSFKQTLESIAMLFCPLTAGPLAELLGVDQSQMLGVLESLNPVLACSERRDTSVKFLHRSFRDYLLDSKRCIDLQFVVVEGETHQRLLASCIRLMSGSLKEDICSLKDPGRLSSAVDGGLIQRSLPPQVRYACRYWFDHFKRSNDNLHHRESLHELVHTFLKQHLLHWLEALSLMGSMSDGVLIVLNFDSILTPDANPELRRLAHDAVRFVLSFRSILETAPLQIYCSALMFSPKRSIIRETFWASVPRWIKVPPVVPGNWDPLLRVLYGHTGDVNTVSFSNEGKFLASASDDGTVRLWDPITGTCLCTLEGHTWSVNAAAFSPDGKLLASASFDSTVRLWDLTGTCRRTLEGHRSSIRAVAFSPDGKLLASASSDKTIRLWDPTTGTCYRTLEGHSDWLNAVAFSPDGKLLVSASLDNTVRLWNSTSGTQQCTLEDNSTPASAAAFSTDGKLLALASFDNTVRLWDPNTLTRYGTLEGHSGYVRGVAFSPDGKLVASASDDGTVRLWDLATMSCCSVLTSSGYTAMSVAFSPDGKLVASASNDGTVQLWDPLTANSQSALDGHSYIVTAVAFSPDGKLAASASEDDTIRLWDPSTGTCHNVLEGHSSAVTAVHFSPDGKLLASTSYDSTIRLWDTMTGICLRTLEGHSSSVQAVAFSPDGKLLISASNIKIRHWDPTTGICHRIHGGHSSSVTALAFSPDGRLFVSASSDKTIRLWDPTTEKCRSTLEGHSKWVTAVTFSPDGGLLASVSYDKTIRLWDPTTGTCRRTIPLKGDPDPGVAIVFSPDGRLLKSRTTYYANLQSTDGLSLGQDVEIREISYLPLTDGRVAVTEEATAGSTFPVDNPPISSFTLDMCPGWITLGLRRLIWLPDDYQTDCFAIHNGAFALGRPSGKVYFMAIDLELVPSGNVPRPESYTRSKNLIARVQN